ncbi:hypothetical protein AeMF1_002653 [Aphanomyces euteiches]|nr:hypothetical protein AeMF1_002653 [Aphanomyces euteiches]
MAALAEVFRVNDVEKSCSRLEHLCSTRQFQVLQDELSHTMAVVPFPQVIRLFALCVHHDVKASKDVWMAYVGLVRLLLDTSALVDIAPDDLVPHDVLDVARPIFLDHLVRRPNLIHASIAWCRLYNIPSSDCIAGTMTLLNIDPHIAMDLANEFSLLSHLPSEPVMRKLLALNDLQNADRFVHGNVERQCELIHLMVALKCDNKLIKKRLTKFHLSPDDFPIYVQRQRRGTIRYLVRAQQFGDIPAAVGSDRQEMIYACDFVYEQCGHDNPVTRHLIHAVFDLGDRFPDVVPLPASSTFVLGDNKDAPPPLQGFLSLATFPAFVAPVVVVDSLASVQDCVTHLMASPTVGLDCEWRSVFDASATTNQSAALLQLASATHAYVIDVMTLTAASNDVATLFAPLFESTAVLKLGLDVRGDFRSLGVQRASPVLDLQTVEKAIRRVATPNEGAKTSLSDLSLQYLGLPMDKRVRMSNWERRPLTSAQLEYAALDAMALVYIFDAMKSFVAKDDAAGFETLVHKWSYHVGKVANL